MVFRFASEKDVRMMIGRMVSRLAAFLRWLMTSETLETLPTLPRPGWSGQAKSFARWLFGREELPLADEASEKASAGSHWLLGREKLPPQEGLPEALPSEPRFLTYLLSREQLPVETSAAGKKPRNARNGGRNH